MATLAEPIKKLHAIVAVFVLTWMYFSSTGVGKGINFGSLKRLATVLLIFTPAMFCTSYFWIWKVLITKPQKMFTTNWRHRVNPPHVSAETESNLACNHEARRWQYVVMDMWSLLLFTVLLSAHLSLPYLVFMGKIIDVTLLAYLLFTSLGVYFVLFGVLIIVQALEFAAGLTLPNCIQWKWFQSNWCFIRILTVFLAVIGLVVPSLIYAAADPMVKYVQIPVRKLAISHNGLRVIQLSDIHLGPTVGLRQLQQTVKITNALNPDIVVITGDLVDSTVENLAEAVSPLGQLTSRYGVFFVTGNHEYFTHDVDNWLIHLESIGVKCLPNKHVKIADPANVEDWFYIAGTNDLEARDRKDYFNLDKALEGTNKDHAIILLAHQPRAAQLAIQSEYDLSLILSGHTHGGQFFPVHILAYLVNPYFAGIYQPKEGTYLYVSSGTWYNGPPLRLFSQAEITVLTLLST